MNARKLMILCLIVVLAWLVPLGGSQRGSSAQTSPARIESATSLDSDYLISNLTWKVEGVTSGGEYSLESASAPASSGNGCCCTYLPCILLSR